MAPSCKVCQQTDDPDFPLKKCGKCNEVFYCSADCQKEDWKSHKKLCGKAWYEDDRIRKCRDGSLHKGKLELITWNTPADPHDPNYSEDLGWELALLRNLMT
ncbi:hypothetical protein DL98DRAFT_516563 [Cadophora sp. DSE1049]|nr:hypothetical protein DL98DRAFT_516563 [Cadophora sp. DSE1049]